MSRARTRLTSSRTTVIPANDVREYQHRAFPRSRPVYAIRERWREVRGKVSPGAMYFRAASSTANRAGWPLATRRHSASLDIGRRAMNTPTLRGGNNTVKYRRRADTSAFLLVAPRDTRLAGRAGGRYIERETRGVGRKLLPSASRCSLPSRPPVGPCDLSTSTVGKERRVVPETSSSAPGSLRSFCVYAEGRAG